MAAKNHSTSQSRNQKIIKGLLSAQVLSKSEVKEAQAELTEVRRVALKALELEAEASAHLAQSAWKATLVTRHRFDGFATAETQHPSVQEAEKYEKSAIQHAINTHVALIRFPGERIGQIKEKRRALSRLRGVLFIGESRYAELLKIIEDEERVLQRSN